VAIILLCSYISFVDVLRHRISGASIAALSLILILEGEFELYFFSGFTFLAMFLFVGIASGMGGGDVKLLVALALFGIKTNEIATFLLFLTLSTTVLAILTIAARLSLRGNIALAPSICGSYLLLLLSR
jgi:Flp pilus assembly protein protease CpaA